MLIVIQYSVMGCEGAMDNVFSPYHPWDNLGERRPEDRYPGGWFMIAIYHKGLPWIFMNLDAYENRQIRTQKNSKDPVVKMIVDISDVFGGVGNDRLFSFL